MDTFAVILVFIAVFALASLIYLNFVATLIIFKMPESALGMNILRSLFVWLIPIIGFGFSLRFTQQTFESDLHYRLVPKIVRDWIYDDRFVPDNPNADHRFGKAFMLGVSRGIDNWRGKF